MAATRPRPEMPPVPNPPASGARPRPSGFDELPTTRMSAVTAERAPATSWLDSLRPGRSLRARLILAFAAIIFLTLVLVGIGFVFIIRQYQEQRELLRLGTLIGPILGQSRQVEQQGRTLEDARDFLDRQADELDVRLVLARPNGVILYDSDDLLVNHRIDVVAADQLSPLQRVRLVTAPGVDDRNLRFIYLQPGGNPDRPLPRPGGPNGPILAIIHEPPTVASVLSEMAPRLLLAALVSLSASIVVAWLLAASIARPLARMTRAAEDMSHGRYDHEIDVRGDDEVGRLAVAFNAMVREVARSQRTLRDFVANVSHDLRTPLTSIQGFSQAMVDGALRTPEDYAEAGRVINEEAERMRRLVEDLLELSKIESGQVHLEPGPCELEVLAHQTVERAERRIAEHGVTLTLALDATPIVRADGRWVERAVDNLLDNALKHTPAGGTITLAIGTMAVPPGSRVVSLVGRHSGEFGYIAVHNTGSFIPPGDQPRVFERFYQVDKARSTSGSGSGLGLAIAQEIVQAHGGWIHVQSSLAGGTEFAVMLPLLDRGSGRTVGSLRPEREIAS
ncbi:MAG: HAMP domain-containing histidine kinase [Chloroflexi bacterium]|nr:HAMP domain-containing histidine kinase [Chloroflexota bacterium]